MDALLPEHLALVVEFLEPNTKINLATTGENYTCEYKKTLIETTRKKTIRILCANIFKSLFQFGENGILFEDEADMKTELKKTEYFSQKQKTKVLCDVYSKWISKYIIKKYNYNDMGLGCEEIQHHRNRARYTPEKFAYSLWPFNHPLDNPTIKNPNNIKISIVYRVRTIGIQYKTIKNSLQLKALVG
jgi:hypothetical protein